jgi:hypothetical protein
MQSQPLDINFLVDALESLLIPLPTIPFTFTLNKKQAHCDCTQKTVESQHIGIEPMQGNQTRTDRGLTVSHYLLHSLFYCIDGVLLSESMQIL